MAGRVLEQRARTRGRRALPTYRALGGASWTVVDQVLSALSNLVISLAVGRAAGSRLLGEFTVLFTVYLLALGFQRSLVSEPLMAQPLDESAARSTSADAAALRCGGIYAVAVAVGTGVVGGILGSPKTLALAAVLPLLLGQDLLRYVALRRRRPRRAAALDGTWLVVVLACWPFLVSSHGVVRPLLIWGGGAGLALLWGVLSTSGRSSGAAAVQWWRTEARRFGGLLAVDSVVHALAYQGVVLALAGLLGLSQLGQLRAATLLLGPTGTALVAFNAFVLPRLASRAAGFTRRQALQLSSASAGLAAVVVGVTVAIGPATADLFFGRSIHVGYDLLVPLGGGMVLGAFAAGLVLHLKALRQVGLMTVLRLGAALLSVPLLVYLAARHGLEGAVLGLLLQYVLGAFADITAWVLALKRTPTPT